MDTGDLVRAYYPSAGLADAVVDVLAGAGIDVAHLTVQDLSAVDQLHAGGAAATALVLERIISLLGRLSSMSDAASAALPGWQPTRIRHRSRASI